VQVGDERARVSQGEAIVWPAGVAHGAYTDGTEMRAIVVEFSGADDGWARGVVDALAASGGVEAVAPADGSLARADPRPEAHDRSQGEPW